MAAALAPTALASALGGHSSPLPSVCTFPYRPHYHHRPCLPPLASSITPLASLVPDFPRLFDVPGGGSHVGDTLPRLPGFNVNDAVRIFLPDLLRPMDLYTVVLVLSCTVAFIYFEGGALVQDFMQEQELERLEEDFLDNASGTGREGEETAAKELTPQEIALKERRRGLAWLALVVALAVWCTGIVNTSAPFQP